MNSHAPSLLILLLVFTVPVTAAPPNDDPGRRVVTHTASETVRIPATRARLTVIVENEAKNSALAQQVVAQRSNTVRDFLQSNNVARLQAGAMTLHPIHETSTAPYAPRDRTEITGYRAQWHATFEVEAELAGRIVDGVVAAGAARVTNFAFTATEAALADAQRDAFRRAALRARDDAHTILDALGYKPAEIGKVTVNGGSPIMPFGRRVEAMAASSADLAPAISTAIEPGYVEVTGAVTLEVGY
jgi:uncharacterized protein YggE